MGKFNRNELGRIGSIRRWTPSAIDCYERNCICKDCPIKNFITSQKCQMKATVIELVKALGKPNKTAQF